MVFTGWEWTQANPWGHKNVIMKYDDPAKLPPQPVRCYKGITGFRPQDWFDSQDPTFLGETPEELFGLLKRYCTEAGIGCEAVVIPHGNAWGEFAIHTYWNMQMNPTHHDPELQRLIEVYSKHGNSEEYRDFPPDYRYFRDGAEVSPAECEDGSCEKICQEPTESYEPCCWRAGEIVKERCVDPDSAWCVEQVELARQTIKPFSDGVPREFNDRIKPKYRSKPSKVKYWEWRACDQCLDCYQPAFNYNHTGSAQYALTRAYFDETGNPLYYRFGFMASTDTHQGLPASVMEDKKQADLKQAHGFGFLYSVSEKTGFEIVGTSAKVPNYGYERISNYLNPGGIVAVLAERRDRDHLWEALKNRHVYGTTGDRIEVWLRAEVKEEGQDKIVMMGDITSSSKNPVFHLKARGAFREDGTCRYDEHPEIQAAMSKSEFERVCYNLCYSPLDERVPIARIEIIKIRQPLSVEEANMETLKWSPQNPDGLIMDPYQVLEFNSPQVDMIWKDESFKDEAPDRSVAYYFRVIQEAAPGYNCNPTARLSKALTCDNRVPYPDYVAEKANPQDGSTPVSRDQLGDLCYSDAGVLDTYCEERAWTSPIYIVRE